MSCDPACVRILFIGSAPTVGDGGIGAATLAELRRCWPDAEIVIQTSTPQTYAAFGVAHGATVEAKAHLEPAAHARLPLGLDAHLRYLWRLLDVRLFGGRFGGPALARDVRERFGWADVVVYQGGPGWNRRFLDPTTLRVRLLRLAAARHHGTPSVLYAQSFGPFDWSGPRGRLLRWFTATVLNQVQLITVRDTFSIAHLRRLGVRRPTLVQAADAALRLAPASPARGRALLAELGVQRRKRPLVGLSVRAMRARYGYHADVERRVRRELARFCDAVLDELADIVFLSTDYGEHADYDNDLECFADIRAMMRRDDGLSVVDRELQPAEVAAVYGELDVVAAVRLHPAIFSLVAGTPALSVGYDPKCRDLMTDLGLPDWHLEYADFTADAGVARLRTLLSDPDAAARRVDAAVAAGSARSARSLDALRELLGA